MKYVKSVLSSCGFVLTLVLCIAGCSGQGGRFRVTERRVVELPEGAGTIDILFGYSNSSGTSKEKSLLIFIACDPSRNFTQMVRSGGDGIVVSALNVDLSEGGPSEFGFGASWNRTSDDVALNEHLFARASGSSFVVASGTNNTTIIQLRDLSLGNDLSDAEVIARIAKVILDADGIPNSIEKYFKGLGSEAD